MIWRAGEAGEAGESATKSHYHAGENHTNHALTNDYTITARIYKPESCCFRVKKGQPSLYTPCLLPLVGGKLVRLRDKISLLQAIFSENYKNLIFEMTEERITSFTFL